MNFNELDGQYQDALEREELIRRELVAAKDQLSKVCKDLELEREAHNQTKDFYTIALSEIGDLQQRLEKSARYLKPESWVSSEDVSACRNLIIDIRNLLTK